MSIRYHYTFPAHTPPAEIRSTIGLAVLSAEGLHGAAARLEASPAFDVAERTCVVPADSPPGRDLNRILTGLLVEAFGRDGFEVERLLDPHNAPHPQASADGLRLILPPVEPSDVELGGDRDD